MKVLIVSDTHGYNDDMWKVIMKEEPFDMMIHCGDLECDPQLIRDRVDCTLHVVAGNNDYDPDMDRVRVFNIGRFRALLTHGHRQKVYSDYSGLYYLGLENQVDFVFFGHVHIPIVRKEGAITLINPGSLTYPRQIDRKPTYIVMTMENGKEPEIIIKNI